MRMRSMSSSPSRHGGDATAHVSIPAAVSAVAAPASRENATVPSEGVAPQFDVWHHQQEDGPVLPLQPVDHCTRPRRRSRPRSAPTSTAARSPASWRRRSPTWCCRGSDGIEMMNDIRKTANMPVTFLSVYGQDETVARALDMGLPTTWPSPSRRRSWRRGPGQRSGSGWTPSRAGRRDPTRSEGWASTAHCAGSRWEESRWSLPATEYAVLYELAVHAPRTLTHAVLLQRIWGRRKSASRGCCGTW